MKRPEKSKPLARAIVDRIEDGRLAVFSVKGGGQMILPVRHFHGQIHEGQVFDFWWRADALAEKRLRDQVRDLQQSLLKRSKPKEHGF